MACSTPGHVADMGKIKVEYSKECQLCELDRHGGRRLFKCGKLTDIQSDCSFHGINTALKAIWFASFAGTIKPKTVPAVLSTIATRKRKLRVGSA